MTIMWRLHENNLTNPTIMIPLQTNAAAPSVSHILHIMTVLLLASLAACSKTSPDAPPAMPAMPVSVMEMQPATVPVSIEVIAQTEGAREIEVRPRVGGILLRRLYTEGSEVVAGQPMFLIDPTPYQTVLAQEKARRNEQQARIEQTAREKTRLKELLATRSISQREYDTATSDDAIASALLQQAEARLREAGLNLSYTTVTAPVKGISGRFQLSEGALVSANTSLLTTIVQLSPIWVRFSLSDNELLQLGGRLTEKTVREVTLILPDGTEYSEKGKLNFVASQIDPSLGTQQLRATFENASQRLMPGQFVRIRVTTGQQDGIFLVPQTAVMTSDLGKAIYVVGDNNTAMIRPIVTGNWSGKDWIVLEGLKAGDKIITDNIIKLRPGTPVSPHPAQPPEQVPAAGDKTAVPPAPETVPEAEKNT